MTIAQARKALAGAAALVAQLVAAGLLEGTALKVAQALIVAAGVAGIYAVPNDKADEGQTNIVAVGVFILLVAIAWVILSRNGVL